ncbi:GNAT family N-acetyltransferase [Dermacoccaceae bacterium W4C1]
MSETSSSLPPGYPSSWEADLVLRDGSLAQVRPIKPSDTETIQRFHDAQSEESIYLRFFAPLKHLSDRDANRFTHVDYAARVALVMTQGEDLLGIARYDRLDGTTGPVAEVAFNVADRYQGRGIGSVLLEHLAAIGQEAGVRRFVADVLPQNRRMMAVFKDAGYEVKHRYDDGVIVLGFDISRTQQSEQVRADREQRAESVSVKALLNPASVAVVGVSRRDPSVGRQLLRGLGEGGFTGTVHAVTLEGGDIDGHPTHPSVRDIEGPVDLAVIAVPAEAVLDVVQDCAAKGVRALLVVSAGFAEAGEAGMARQAALLRTARRNGMRVIGPNSFGIINTDEQVHLNASLAPVMPRSGSLGLLAQSGALGIAVLDLLERRGLGLSQFVSAGNRIDVSGNDLMQHWFDDERTEVVGLYLESMGNPRKFSRIARRLASRKPVVVVKSDVSAYGVPRGHRVRVTQARPGAFRSMLNQAGVIRVDSLHRLFDVAQLLVNQPLPAGDRVAVVGNSDALGVIAADAAVSRDLQITRRPVSLPAEASAAEFRTALDEAFADPEVDSVVAVFIPPLVTDGLEVARALAQSSVAAGKPCVATFLGIHGVPEVLTATDEQGRTRAVPSYSMPEDAVRALAAATKYGQWRLRDHGTLVEPEGVDRAAAERVVRKVLQESPTGRRLQAEEADELLACYGITRWPATAVSSLPEALAAAERLGYPVVLKSVSPLVRHQPVAAMRADIRSADSLREAWAALDERLAPLKANRFVVQRMAVPGVACVVGSNEDPLFGPVVRFSLAGAPTELLEDVGLRIPPLTTTDVSELISSVKAAPLLNGHGGAAPVDRRALEDLVARISLLADQLPEVVDLELNPVNCRPDGLDVLGAEVRVAPPGRRADTGRRALS